MNISIKSSLKIAIFSAILCLQIQSLVYIIHVYIYIFIYNHFEDFSRRLLLPLTRNCEKDMVLQLDMEFNAIIV